MTYVTWKPWLHLTIHWKDGLNQTPHFHLQEVTNRTSGYFRTWRKSDVLIIQIESMHYLSGTINVTHCLCLKKIWVLVFSTTSYVDTISDPVLSMNPSLTTEVENAKNLSPKERKVWAVKRKMHGFKAQPASESQLLGRAIASCQAQVLLPRPIGMQVRFRLSHAGIEMTWSHMQKTTIVDFDL